MKKNIKKRTRSAKGFNAYQYANEFEKLSLDIVKIISKSSFYESDIESSDTTQQSRDYGVDAYLVVNIHEKLCTYTIEAKLRTSDCLSLRDFATSILYYLINTSSRHYIVTNVSYSAETVKYIEQLNLSSEKFVELIDGPLLQKTINDKLNVFYHYSKELLTYILEREFDRHPVKVKRISAEEKSSAYIQLPCYTKKIKQIKPYLETRYNFFLVDGMAGTGKSTWIEVCLDELCPNDIKYKIDISTVQTPKCLILELLHLLLGFKIEKLIFELFNEGETNLEDWEPFQVFPGNTEELIAAVKVLLKDEPADPCSYIYLIKLFASHLHEHFLINTHTVFIIENLHEASLDMINFTIDVMYCIGKGSCIVFWELLRPQNSIQLKSVSLEQWNSFVQLLGERHYRNGTLPCIIRMGDLLEEDIRSAIRGAVPDVLFSEEFFQTFIDIFGTNVRKVFEIIQIVKYKKMYSAPSLRTLPSNDSYLIENQLWELLDEACRYRKFYQHTFHFLYLMEDFLDPFIINFLDERFLVNTEALLLKSGLFYKRNHSLKFQYQNIADLLSKFINVRLRTEYAGWLLEHLNELDINYIMKKYYEAKFLYIISAPNSMDKINEAILYFHSNQINKYALPLSEMRWQYYEKKQESLLSYKYYIKYISHLKISLKETELLNERIARAIYLRDMLFSRFSNDPQYIDASLELAFIQYQIAKGNYDYRSCEERLQYILSYENIWNDSEPFIRARIYYALIRKEQGKRKDFILELVNNFRSYRHHTDVKITYYVNMAAMYKFSRMDISIKLMQTAQTLTFDAQKGHGDLETEMNLLHFLCYQGKTENLFSRICFIREMAEKENSIYNLAKTYNAEAYYYISKGLLPSKKDTIIECLESAVFHSTISGQSKQAFLFRLNLIQILFFSGKEYTEELYNALQWFNNNRMIIERLEQNPYKNCDHMFSAFISLLCALKKLNMVHLIKKDMELQRFLAEYEDMEEPELFDLLPNYYKVSITAAKKREFIYILF